MSLEFDFLQGLRSVMLVLTAFVLVVFAFKYVKFFADLSVAQRLYIGAMLCFIITTIWDTSNYISDAEAFSWRMLPLTAGLILSYVYLLEPARATQRRLGQDPYDPQGGFSAEEARALRLENSELRDRLYEAINMENKNALRIIELEAESEESRRTRQ